MKRHNKPSSKKLNLDKQAVRELKLVETQWADDVTGGTLRLAAAKDDGDC